jgi:hypothetical protein
LKRVGKASVILASTTDLKMRTEKKEVNSWIFAKMSAGRNPKFSGSTAILSLILITEDSSSATPFNALMSNNNIGSGPVPEASFKRLRHSLRIWELAVSWIF